MNLLGLFFFCTDSSFSAVSYVTDGTLIMHMFYKQLLKCKVFLFKRIRNLRHEYNMKQDYFKLQCSRSFPSKECMRATYPQLHPFQTFILTVQQGKA